MTQTDQNTTIPFGTGQPILTLTDAAAAQARKLMGKADSEAIGLRVGIKTAGCSGLQYQVEFAKDHRVGPSCCQLYLASFFTADKNKIDYSGTGQRFCCLFPV